MIVYLVKWKPNEPFLIETFPTVEAAKAAEATGRKGEDPVTGLCFRPVWDVTSLEGAGGPWLVRLYNFLTGEDKKSFHDLPTARRKVLEALQTKYPDPEPTTPVEESTTEVVESGETETTTVEAPITEGTEDMTTKKATKAKKTAKPKKEGGPKKPGVIDALVNILENGGGTIEKMVSKLKTKFPDRDEEAMKSTVKIQVNRLTKSKDEGGRNLKIKSEQAVEGSNEKKYWV